MLEQLEPQALSDVKVLDLTHHIAGPYCTKMLADYGADVIKVERPDGGDVTRRRGPFPDDIPHPEKSGLFLHLNMNKRGITLNLKSAAGRKIFLELVAQTDVVVENFSPRVMPSLGLSYENLEKVNPGIILVSVSNFGQTGPYRDYKASEITLHGMGGSLHNRGVPEREPGNYGTEVALRQAGLIGATATMVAMFMREQRGAGEHVDVSIFETQAGSMDGRNPEIMRYQFVGDVGTRSNSVTGPAYPCKDGYITISSRGRRFELVLAMVDRVDLLEDARFATPAAQNEPENILYFEQEILLPWLMQRNVQEVWALAQDLHIQAGPVNNAANLLADEHFRDRGMWVEVEHPVAGRLTYPGRPGIWSETPWQLRRPAPLLGEHNEEVLSGTSGYGREDLVRLRGLGVI